MRELILLLEPPHDTLPPVASELVAAGFEVERTTSWAQARRRIRERRPDALLIQAPRPDVCLERLCRDLRQDAATRELPSLVLSEPTDARFCERTLEAGADDVVVRPVHPREIVLRLRALLRRSAPRSTDRTVLCVGTLRLEMLDHLATVNGRELPLTVTEFRLLAELARHAGKVCSREDLIRSLRTPGTTVGARVVDTQVRRIRRKLGAAKHYLRTVRGFGYCLVDREGR